jgi:CubicO group peptidase (beta-lactamase class C family)
MNPQDLDVVIAPDRARALSPPRKRAAAAIAAVAVFGLAGPVLAQETMEARITELVPALDAYIEKGMKDFDLPGLAIGIVTGDKLVYAKGFGVRRKGGEPVDTNTLFQIGSTTKAFLATTMAIAVDGEEFAWDDRVVDLYPEFQMKDSWVTREFRVFDLLAQRSGMPPYANDAVGTLGFDQPAMIHSLRYVEPVSSFRSTFAYTNITHMLAQRIVAKVMGAEDWDSVVRSEIFTPLGMKDSSFTAEAIEAAANHTVGYRWTPEGTVEVPFTPIFPYGFGGAGAINSTIPDMAHWLRLQLADGEFEGKRIVSAANLNVTRIGRVGMSDRLTYAMGWVQQSTPNGMIIWHNGGTTSYGAFVGFLPDKDVGVIILTNEANVGFPDAVGLWTLDRLMDNPVVDHVAAKLKAAKAGAASSRKMFEKPATPRTTPPLAPLAGNFTSPTFGKAKITVDGDGLLATIGTTGAKLTLAPWDGGILTATLLAEGPLAAMATNLGPDPLGFVEFQMDKDGKLNILKLSMSDGQAYEFRRE